MSDESSSGGGISRLIGAGVILLAMAVFGYKQTQPLLKSARPKDTDKRGFPDPTSGHGLHAFYARLWEDPLLACYQHEEKTSETKPAGAANGDYKDTMSKVLLSDDGTDDPPTKIARVLCLPVMLSGTAFGDDHEERMRTAYAVHAALAVSGYELAFPTRMSYVDVPVALSVRIRNTDQAQHPQQFRVPVKLFRRSSSFLASPNEDAPPKYAVVLWINADLAQDRPLNVVAQILHQLFDPKRQPIKDFAEGHPGNMIANFLADMLAPQGDASRWKDLLDVRVIGPADSDGLETMRYELTHPSTACGVLHPFRYNLSDFSKSAIYSPRSTLPVDLKADKGKTPIHHVIGDDRQLAKALVEELELRDAASGLFVLLTERDTLYGRRFGQVFKDELPTTAQANVREYRFLRGIDGALANSSPATPGHYGTEPLAEQHAAPVDSDSDDAHVAPPRGRAQKDYLSRLESELVTLHEENRINGSPGISAIGVVGSDVYDKLMILRALRKRFPKVVFFTTDLDAALAKVDESETARNLVVASHFGLELNDDLQKATPPFRDSYQTATYFSTLMALGYRQPKQGMPQYRADPWYSGGKSCQETLRPLVFEIGLQGAYQLTPTSRSPTSLSAAIFPRSPRETVSAWRYLWRALLILLAAAGLAFCGLAYSSTTRRSIMGDVSKPGGRLYWNAFGKLAVVTILLAWPWALILYDHLQADGQPFSMHQGISLWPATYLRYIAFCTAAVLTGQTIQKLHRLRIRFDDKWQIVKPIPGRFEWPELRGLLRQRFLRFAWNAAWNNVFVFNWPDVRPGWIRHPRNTDTRPSAKRLYNDFAQRLEPRFMLLRTLPLLVAFFVFVWLLMLIDGLPSNPFRGTVSRIASIVAIAGAAFTMILLTLLVIDATQLCRRFIGALEYADLDWDAAAELERLAEQRGDQTDGQAEATRALYTLQIIVECSNVVGKLIKYPFIVVFLMVIARLPAFDYLDLNWILVLLWTLLLGMAGYSAYDLRQTAAKTRRGIVKRLRDRLSALAADNVRSEQQRQAIDEIEKETGGAFGPPLSDPLMTAVAIPFGGSTLLLIIQRFLPDLVL